MIIVSLITREVGGGRVAQALAAWGYAYGTFTLNFGHILMTASVDLVVWPEDPGVVVLASNYGEAGALARFSSQPDVLAVSGHNALGYLPGPPPRTRTVVVVGSRLSRVAGEFTTCQTVDHLDSGFEVDNEEEGQPIAVCTGPKRPWTTLWPALRHLADEPETSPSSAVARRAPFQPSRTGPWSRPGG